MSSANASRSAMAFPPRATRSIDDANNSEEGTREQLQDKADDELLVSYSLCNILKISDMEKTDKYWVQTCKDTPPKSYHQFLMVV